MTKRGEVEWLTPAQEETVRKALLSGATRDEAAAAIGISRSRLDTRLRDQLSGLRVGRGRRERRRGPQPDPTPDEIALRAAAIRRSWPTSRWLPEPLEDDPESR